MSDLSADGQTNYDEPSPTDAPQPLARPISQEGRLANTPFQTQRLYADVGIPKSERKEYDDAIKALEEQMGRKLSSKERDQFLRTGSIPEADPAEPTPVSETALFGAGGGVPNLEDEDLIERIDAAPFVGQQRANFRIPTAGSSGLRGAAPYQFGSVFEEAYSSTTAKRDQNFAFNFGSRPTAMGQGRFRPRIL